jgi:hypothetical protein
MSRCHSCDIEIASGEVTAGGRAYCCAGCADGGPCICTYADPAHRQHSNGHADSLLVAELLGRAFGLRLDDLGGRKS